MPTIHTHRSTNIKTIALAATLTVGAAALVALAMIDPPTDAEMPVPSFDAAPSVATSSPDAAPPATATLLSAVAAGSRQSGARPVSSRVASEPSSAAGPTD